MGKNTFVKNVISNMATMLVLCMQAAIFITVVFIVTLLTVLFLSANGIHDHDNTDSVKQQVVK